MITAISLLEEHHQTIKELCAKHKVKRLSVFGSSLTENFSHESDIDFIVEFQDVDATKYADNYFELKFSLEGLLRRPIDLLEYKAIRNPFLRGNIDRTKQLVYGT